MLRVSTSLQTNGKRQLDAKKQKAEKIIEKMEVFSFDLFLRNNISRKRN